MKTSQPDVAVLSLKAADAQIAILLRDHGIKSNPLEGKAIVEAVESHWVTMQDDDDAQTWGCSVFDFNEPPLFLLFDIGTTNVTVCVGAAELEAFTARQIADETFDAPMSKMLERIEKSPEGWVTTLHVRRSEFELEPISYPTPTFN